MHGCFSVLLYHSIVYLAQVSNNWFLISIKLCISELLVPYFNEFLTQDLFLIASVFPLILASFSFKFTTGKLQFRRQKSGTRKSHFDFVNRHLFSSLIHTIHTIQNFGHSFSSFGHTIISNNGHSFSSCIVRISIPDNPHLHNGKNKFVFLHSFSVIAQLNTSLTSIPIQSQYKHLITKVTCHNFDDLVRQCYWVWGDMTSITV